MKTISFDRYVNQLVGGDDRGERRGGRGRWRGRGRGRFRGGGRGRGQGRWPRAGREKEVPLHNDESQEEDREEITDRTMPPSSQDAGVLNTTNSKCQVSNSEGGVATCQVAMQDEDKTALHANLFDAILADAGGLEKIPQASPMPEDSTPLQVSPVSVDSTTVREGGNKVKEASADMVKEAPKGKKRKQRRGCQQKPKKQKVLYRSSCELSSLSFWVLFALLVHQCEFGGYSRDEANTVGEAVGV